MPNVSQAWVDLWWRPPEIERLWNVIPFKRPGYKAINTTRSQTEQILLWMLDIAKLQRDPEESEVSLFFNTIDNIILHLWLPYKETLKGMGQSLHIKPQLIRSHILWNHLQESFYWLQPYFEEDVMDNNISPENLWNNKRKRTWQGTMTKDEYMGLYEYYKTRFLKK